VRITWSPLAVQRVLEAAEFIALDKPEAAARWVEAAFEAVERLAGLPKSGRRVPEIGRDDVREIVHGSLRIVYRIDSEQVFILTVRHSRRQFDPNEAD
jgi:toxin ParE1/3/4